MIKDKKIVTYKDLDVWKKSHELTIRIYRITNNFPKDEIYGLISQLRKASYSIPANIAEGNGKQYLKEYIQYLYISKSSLNEVEYFLLLSKDLDYMNINEYDELVIRVNVIDKMLIGLIKSLKKKTNN
jgi:four helix bundle protein